MARRVGKYLELLLFALLFGLCMNAMAFAGTVNETPDSSGEVSGVEQPIYVEQISSPFTSNEKADISWEGIKDIKQLSDTLLQDHTYE